MASGVEGGHNYTYPQGVDKSVNQSPERLFRNHAKQLVTLTWGIHQWKSFKKIVARESSWNPNAYNTTTGAYGIGQLIGSKKYTKDMPYLQINKMVQYIAHRYGTPTKALQHHLKYGWY